MPCHQATTSNTCCTRRVGPLSIASVNQYLREAGRACGLLWREDEVVGLAKSTHGVPLIMRLTLEMGIHRASAS
jgi:hypothetical protein